MQKLAVVSLLFLLVAGCGARAGLAPMPSPDGSMVLSTRIEQRRADPGSYLCVVFEIRDHLEHVLHTENTRASDMMRWRMSWVGNDRVRLESSDIGAREWKRQADGRWAKDPGRTVPDG